MTPTPSINELAKAAVELARLLQTQGMKIPEGKSWCRVSDELLWKAADLILSLSSRVENARREALEEVETAIDNYRPFPNQDGSVFRGMYEKVAKPELLSIIRNLIPRGKL